MDTELELSDVWQWFPTDPPGCRTSLFAGAVISKPNSSSLYHPLPRFSELAEWVRDVHGFRGSYSKPKSYHVFQRILTTGGEMQMVNSVSQTDMKSRALPTNAGVAFFDERPCVICRDDERAPRVIVDTAAPEAVAWGTSIIEDVRSEARPVDLEQEDTSFRAPESLRHKPRYLARRF